jgi:uncharacterized protein YjiS (DUF1127 family)
MPEPFNLDIQKGPTMEALPTPMQGPTGAPRFDSSGFISEAFQKLPLDTAVKAMEAAVQLEGALGFDADVRAGVPTPVALAKWSSKLFHRSPATIAKLNEQPFEPKMRDVGGHQLLQTGPNRYQLAPGMEPSGPVEAQEVMGPGGTPLAGVTAIRGRGGSVHVIPEKATGPNPTQLGMLIKHQLDDIGLQLRDVGAEGGIAENSPEHKQLMEEQKRYRSELRKLTDTVLTPKSSVSAQASKAGLPAAPSNPKQREAGRVYMTPKGPHKWTGEHWVAP